MQSGNRQSTPSTAPWASPPLLSDTEINDIVAFLHTLSDGYFLP